MRARPTNPPALILGVLLTSFSARAQGPPSGPRPAAVLAEKPLTAQPKAPVIAPATPADVTRERLATEVRLKELTAPEARDKPTNGPSVDLLKARQRLLDQWEKTVWERQAAEKPEPSPEREAADQKADLEKTRVLLEQAAKAPDSLLPEVFQTSPANASTIKPEARLVEMKEAIDSARTEWKDRAAELESLRSEGARTLMAQVATLRTERDKVHQGFVALTARRGERESAIQAASSPEARDLARDRLVNFDWEARIEAERLAAIQAKIALTSKKLDLGIFQIQARAARVELAKKVVERMENRYSVLAEKQRIDLKQAVAKEETRAALSDDPLVRRRAQRTAQLFELESQVVAYEKAYATAGSVSLQEQATLADALVRDYAELSKMLDDNEVSPLDALRLKNDFRRIGPERAQIVRTDLAAAIAEEIAYENALTDAEIDLVNDSRDDRYDRESLLEQLPEKRRAEASSMLDELETRHRALLNRRRNVLVKLAGRSEETHKQVARRIATLDKEYAFIRAHIFWIRDAEPLGLATIAHARDESIRTARALARLAVETSDRSLWGHLSPLFLAAMIGLVVLPWPLRLTQKALDRYRLQGSNETTLDPIDEPTEPWKSSQVMGDG